MHPSKHSTRALLSVSKTILWGNWGAETLSALARSHTARKQHNWDFQLGYWSSLDQPEEKNQEQEKKRKERSVLQHPPLQGQKRNWEGECTGCPETWNRGKGSSLQILIKREGSPVESDLYEREWEFKEVFKKAWGRLALRCLEWKRCLIHQCVSVEVLQHQKPQGLLRFHTYTDKSQVKGPRASTSNSQG